MGIKGVGMTGLAIIATQMGKKVTGSDLNQTFITDETLQQYPIQIYPNFDPNLVEKVDLVVATGAHQGKNNPQCQRAIQLGIPVLMHAQAVALFAQNKKIIAIAGCHGKTTTTAMVSFILEKNNYDPSYLIGTSTIPGLKSSANYSSGKYFIIEADEYVTCPQTDPTPRFHYYQPEFSVITNIEYDHPDVYPNEEATKKAFTTFIKKTKKTTIIGLDSPLKLNLQNETDLPSIKTFNQTQPTDYHLEKYSYQNGKLNFTINNSLFKLSIPGLHNALNATAAYSICQEIGLSDKQIKLALKKFKGTKRRFEYKGKFQKTPIYDDYAHHPTEIVATLQAARELFPNRRIITVFQAHTYSRTKALYQEFTKSFQKSNLVITAPIFASAREKKDHSINNQDFTKDIQQNSKTTAFFLPEFKDITNWCKQNLTPQDVLLTLGAGNIYKIGDCLL